jgi:hypothetical protein
MTGANTAIAGDLEVGDDLTLASDASVLAFGANGEVRIEHVHNEGLTLKHTATADDRPFILTLATGETDMQAADVLGSIRFSAPDEGTGTDAITVAAEILAISEGDFAADNNATSLHLRTGASAAASDALIITSDNNMALGMTPSAWHPEFNAFQIGANTSLVAYYNAVNGVSTWLGTNTVRNAAGNDVYMFEEEASRFGQDQGSFQFLRAASGTGTISWTDLAQFTGTGAVFNEGSADLDFRIESNTGTHAFFIDGANGRTGINHSTPEARLEIDGASETGLAVTGTVAGETVAILQGGGTGNVDILSCRDSNAAAKFRVLQNGRGLGQFPAKVWVRVDMSNMSVPDSFGVSSITDISTGIARINLSVDMGNSSYNISTSGLGGYIAGHSNIAAGSFYLRHGDSNWNVADQDYAMALVHGDD